MTDTPSIFDLDSRNGWPDELRVLLRQYPRATWTAHGSPLATFWLDKHDFFREQGRRLAAAAQAYREERCSPSDLIAASAPRLQMYLGSLHGHHQIEDYHYFPMFRAADRRLDAGFDALAHDHEGLHRNILDIVEAANELIVAGRDIANAQADRQRHAADRYSVTCEQLVRRLGRHLDDEEDLIIPVMLARGE